jgi:uncharacterized protein (TIGR02246 family)
MARQSSGPEQENTLAPNDVRTLYQLLLESWNKRNAAAFAALFDAEGKAVGFDGTVHQDRAGIESDLSCIFAQHQTPAYIAVVRSVRMVTPELAILSAVAGLVPSGQSDINPAVNAVQTLVAMRKAQQWFILLFQNTPAAFHGRPELSEQLTAELRQALHSKPV